MEATGNDAASCFDQGRCGIAGSAIRPRRSKPSTRLRDVECAAGRAESQAHAARRAWLGVWRKTISSGRAVRIKNLKHYP